ncbi:ABC transporter permease subunit [Halolamina salifodinae]|uniref:ABC-type spermidine/putrescine transport system permease subunit II n=1 Tax=Halolamina salifodinae TaxID=1202767 RepID=A0A8T4GWJ2_9EURY|nr:ABC transporter permease subunit [Halolamina salifodinae]MBP1986820.1 ABC-type spermidine/putrescine transport system permease subunit II [Halolamina salifodinae]
MKTWLNPLFEPLHERLLSFVQEHKDSKWAPIFIMSPYLLYMGVFFAIPVVYMFAVSFFTNVATGTMEATLTLENYVEVFTTSLYVDTLLLTVEISLISTLIAILVSYPIAYFIVFSSWKYSKVLILAAVAPMLVGNVVRAFGWYALLDTSGLVNQIISVFGIEYTLLNTKPGLIIAIASVLMPFAVLILLSNLFSIDQDLLQAGQSLGGNPLQTFWYVTFPLSMPGIVGATLISFVLTMGTFSTAVFIGMPQVPMIGPLIYQAAAAGLNWPLGAAMSFVLLAVALALITIYGRVMEVGSSRQGVQYSLVSDESAEIGRERAFSFAGLLEKLPFDKRVVGTQTLGALLLRVGLVAAFVFLLIPVIFAVLISFSQGLYVIPPETPTLQWYIEAVNSGRWISSFVVSFQYSIIATLISLTLSFSAAYTIGRYDFPMKQAINSATFLPLIIPQLILGIALLIFLNQFGLVGNILGLSIAIAVYATPFATQSMLIAMENFDEHLEEAAQMLGADEIQTFLRVTVPCLLPGIMSAGILAFIISYSNLQIAVFMQGPGIVPVPVRIFSQMQFGATPIIAAIATINILITLIAIMVVERLFGAAEALGYA